MDIEELGMILSKNYDAIRDKNIEIENETAALERETRLRLEDMESEIQTNIDEMKLQMDTLLSDLKKSFKSQSDEFHEDIQMDMKALETGDDFQKNLRTDLRTIKKALQADILNMKLDFRSALETLDENAMTAMADLSDRSREELNVTVEQILTEAKTTEPDLSERPFDGTEMDAEDQEYVEAVDSEEGEDLPQEEEPLEINHLNVAEIMEESETAEENPVIDETSSEPEPEPEIEDSPLPQNAESIDASEEHQESQENSGSGEPSESQEEFSCTEEDVDAEQKEQE